MDGRWGCDGRTIPGRGQEQHPGQEAHARAVSGRSLDVTARTYIRQPQPCCRRPKGLIKASAGGNRACLDGEAWDLSVAASSLRQGVVSSLGRSGCGRVLFWNDGTDTDQSNSKGPGASSVSETRPKAGSFKCRPYRRPPLFARLVDFARPRSSRSEQPTEARRRGDPLIPAGYRYAAPDAIPSGTGMMRYNEELKKAGRLCAWTGCRRMAKGCAVTTQPL